MPEAVDMVDAPVEPQIQTDIKVVDAVGITTRSLSYEDNIVIDRDRLVNEITNTATMGALIGGFALGNLTELGPSLTDSFNDIFIYLMSVIAVHACTCACLMSAFLYQKANGLHDDDIGQWAKDNEFLLTIPMAKFTGGCVCYLLSVVFLSYRDLAVSDIARLMGTAIGGMSVMMVFMTYGYINYTTKPVNFFKPKDE